jgi:hypothetical protein
VPLMNYYFMNHDPLNKEWRLLRTGKTASGIIILVWACWDTLHVHVPKTTWTQAHLHDSYRLQRAVPIQFYFSVSRLQVQPFLLQVCNLQLARTLNYPPQEKIHCLRPGKNFISGIWTRHRMHMTPTEKCWFSMKQFTRSLYMSLHIYM